MFKSKTFPRSSYYFHVTLRFDVVRSDTEDIFLASVRCSGGSLNVTAQFSTSQLLFVWTKDAIQDLSWVMSEETPVEMNSS